MVIGVEAVDVIVNEKNCEVNVNCVGLDVTVMPPGGVTEI